jgi:hypothetical protein
MDPEFGIILLGFAQALCLVALLGALVALFLSARRARQAVDSVRQRGERLRQAGMDARTATVDRVQRATKTVQTLVGSVERKWQTMRRLIGEVTRPQEPAQRQMVERVARGGGMADRLLRLRAAALKASGQQGPVRSKKT